jgi:hypothetical protein
MWKTNKRFDQSMPKSNPSKTHQVNPPYKPNPHVKIPPFPSALITHHSPLPLIYDLLNESEREREGGRETRPRIPFLFYNQCEPQREREREREQRCNLSSIFSLNAIGTSN